MVFVPRGTTGDESAPAGIDASVPSPARVWNYWLGGKDNFAADRETGERVLQVLPGMRDLARLARKQQAEVVTLLAGSRGIRQFLDIGSGLPTADNTHEVAQRIAPGCRVVYTDNDPVVIRHAQALLNSGPEGRTDYIEADIRDTGRVLAEAARTIDFSRPVAILLMGLLHFIPDEDDPYGIVARLLDAVPSGSYLAIGHGASDIDPGRAAEMTLRYNERSAARITLRGYGQVRRFLDGLELEPPGLVRLDEWWSGHGAAGEGTASLLGYCGVARKP
jgi:O-methyltransferase involved in polyketide biosynthesis